MSNPATFALIQQLIEKELSLVVRDEKKEKSSELRTLCAKEIPDYAKGAWHFDFRSSSSECFTTEGWSIVIRKFEGGKEQTNWTEPVPEERIVRFFIRDTSYLDELLKDILKMNPIWKA